jgi:Reverse transcriptase (RNA-dependent DNA polymerase)
LANAIGNVQVGAPSSYGGPEQFKAILDLLSSPMFSGASNEAKDTILRSLAGSMQPNPVFAATCVSPQTLTQHNAPSNGTPRLVPAPNPVAPVVQTPVPIPAAPPAHSLYHNASICGIAMAKRGQEIEDTLDNLGLKGKNRKRRRQALQTLVPFPAPAWTDLIRIQLCCGNVDLTDGIKAISSLGLDPRMVSYLLKIGPGIEVLVPSWFEEAVRAKAQLNRIPIGNPIDVIPSTREQCNMVLKAITPGASSAKTPAPAKEYLEQWILRIKANMPPSRIKSVAPHAASTDCTLPIGSSYPIFTVAGNFARGPVPTQAEQPIPTSFPMDLVEKPDDDTLSASSINESSFWIESCYSNAHRVRNTRISTPQTIYPHQDICSRRQNHHDTQHLSTSSGRPVAFSAQCPNDSHALTSQNIGHYYEPSPEGHLASSYPRWLQVEYINAHGLNHEKLRRLADALALNTLMFVAETWHQHDNIQRTQPGVLAISPELHRSPVSRGKGGLLLLANENVKHLAHCIIAKEHSISLDICGLTISGIYLPPSLDTKATWSVLEGLPKKVDLVLGDFNATLGARARAAHNDRNNVVSVWAAKWGLGLKTPDYEIESSQIDHILTRPGTICWEHIIAKAPIETDHPILTIKVAAKADFVENPSPRYNIHKLLFDSHRKAFINYIDLLASKLKPALLKICGNTTSQPIKDAIDTYDQLLTDLVQTSLRHCVGTRIPSGLHTAGGHPKPKCFDTLAAIQVVRSAQRESNAKCALESKNPSLTPEREAMEHYTCMYKSTSIRPREEWSSSENLALDLETPQSVILAIKNYPSGKSPGLDGIDRRVLWALTNSPAFIECLTMLYNLCINCRYTPRRWNRSLTSPIPKGGKDPRYICNRRPVSLTVMFRRIFEKIILPRITSSVSLNRGQAGFRTGFSCMTQVLLAEQARHMGFGIRVFLDLKCAYDSVPTDKMIVKLANKGVKQGLVEIVESLFTGCSTMIAVNGSLSEPVSLEKGLFQGSLLSPILFDVFIDDLAADINGPDIQVTMPEGLLFADDILLNCKQLPRMQALLSIVDNWCCTNEMTLNVPKCGTTYSHSPLYIRGTAIPVVDTYPYLGIPLSTSGVRPQDLIDGNIKKATAVLALVKNSLASRSWPPATKINVYKTYIRSLFEYAAPILVALKGSGLFKKEINKGIKLMTRLQHDAVKWAFGMKRAVHTLESMAGLTSIRFRFKELTSRLRLHLESLPQANPLHCWIGSPLHTGIGQYICSYYVPIDRKVESIVMHYRDLSFDVSASKNRMVRYIAPEARLSTGMDATVCIQNTKARTRAIRWRVNTFGIYGTCASCNRRFTRRHVSCMQLRIRSHIVAEYNQDMASGKYEVGYTILDHILNKKMFNLFSTAATGLLNESRGSCPM